MRTIASIHKKLEACRDCPNVCGTPVHGKGNDYAQVYLLGQAPGPHEARFGKPFAYTAGKTLFKWLGGVTHLDEETLRDQIYFAAVARCFPGKHPSGTGDREPDANEIANCSKFIKAEISVIKPKLVIAVGKLAIREVLGSAIKKNFSLADVIGKKFFVDYQGLPVQVVPLPHPSGISTWFKKEPGLTLLNKALDLIQKAWPQEKSSL